MHTHTFTHTRVLRAAPCLLIQLMTVLKHMLTIIAPKMFQNKSDLLGILVSSHVTKRVSSCFREHPWNHSSERIPHPPEAGESHHLFKYRLCSVSMQSETGWTQRSLFQQKPGKSKSHRGSHRSPCGSLGKLVFVCPACTSAASPQAPRKVLSVPNIFQIP